jgi:sulfate transport system permease protein
MGFTLLYLSLLVLIPLSALFLKAASLSWPQLWATVTAPRVLAAYRLSFGAAALAAAINAVCGLLVAWVLVRYRFPGRALIDGLVDLPFALPTAVGGLALTTVYSPNGWIGHVLAAHGIKVVFTPAGIVIALTFIGLPFVVRMVQPVLLDLQAEVEEVPEWHRSQWEKHSRWFQRPSPAEPCDRPA